MSLYQSASPAKREEIAASISLAALKLLRSHVMESTHQFFGGHLLGNTKGIFVAPDKRWLAAFAVDEPNAAPLILTTNWSAAVKH